MSIHSADFELNSPLETSDLAVGLAPHLRSGDTLLLEGPVGAGKTHFARSLIGSLLATPEDVPSPTYTLVQTYDTKAGPLWHADLYRLSNVLEIEELGLIDAFDNAICLIEWPDRLGDLTPAHAATLSFDHAHEEDARHMTAKWSDPQWQPKLAGWGI